MDFLQLIFHFDKQLATLLNAYGHFVYLFLFAIVFLETGLVLTPFLPGDSLLFIVGAFTASGFFNIFLIIFLLSLAAILGDSLNYALGRHAGIRVFSKFKLFRESYLEKARRFYHIHGSKTIILARFVPIVRTFAPFVAGLGKMRYDRFLLYNIIGGVAWVSLFVIGGYLFGNITIIKDNLLLVSLGIVFVSILPLIIEVIRSKLKS